MFCRQTKPDVLLLALKPFFYRQIFVRQRLFEFSNCFKSRSERLYVILQFTLILVIYFNKLAGLAELREISKFDKNSYLVCLNACKLKRAENICETVKFCGMYNFVCLNFCVFVF